MSKERRGAIRKKIPSENFVKDSYQAILRFKLEKIKKLLAEVDQKIENHEKGESLSEEYRITLKARMQLLQERNSIARELNTVVLS